MQRRLSVWLVRGTVQITAVIFAGVGVKGYVLMTWCIEKSGPVFTAGFMPLIQIKAAVIDLLFILHEQHLGIVRLVLLLSSEASTIFSGERAGMLFSQPKEYWSSKIRRRKQICESRLPARTI
uniref:Uncharacterized protein n=1 Tax=Arundo donax TaxID=35708 RepID=A0A0A9H1L0_ARUDO